ncbi:hypothetical protein DU508_04055 [Pedobacter chinensis]|uniref:Entericidin n=1 Tax=Pedobacter chinensis TaxID=2282421 RepID=A0A369Q4B7_9SPHI|nr:hypothetical protein [Pedobacter chinensis]RDC58127.1 hypothetical protein DU508_04055 [Pedobacter chinensis]
MKNTFKLGFLSLALSLAMVACSSDKKADGADSTVTDTTIVDTTIADTTLTDTTVIDTATKI